LPERKHFFSKNISDYSMGAYEGLCEGIDSAFKAVPVAAPAERVQWNSFRRLLY
jgi:hypothetical protein